VDEEEVLEALSVVSSRWEVSLDQPAGDEGDRRLDDLVAAPEAREERENLLGPVMLMIAGSLACWTTHMPTIFCIAAR
jgi:hypothetical protein